MTVLEQAWEDYWNGFQEEYPSIAKIISDSTPVFAAFKKTFITAFVQGNKL